MTSIKLSINKVIFPKRNYIFGEKTDTNMNILCIIKQFKIYCFLND